MDDYVICIPTYRRAKICKQRTLNALARNNIDSHHIFVYVVEEEYDLYKETLDDATYNQIIIGVKGLVCQRQFIANQWAENKHILYLDDDVENFDLSLTEHKTLDDFIKHAFAKCIELHSFIWGVYPVFNPFFRKSKLDMTTQLNFIIGAFYGVINRPTCEKLYLSLTNENAGKEDVERTLKYFINDGIVLRFNKIGFKTKYYGADGGGLGKFKDRLKPMADACEKLQAMYGDYGKIKVRKNKMSEFVLKPLKTTINLSAEDLIVTQLPAFDMTSVYDLCKKTVFSPKRNRTNRLGFPEYRGAIFGNVRGRFNGITALSLDSRKRPELYAELVRVGGLICPFPFNKIQLNYNLQCPPHKDSGNESKSLLISFGEYTGGEIVVEGTKYSAYHTPTIFDGCKLTHYNEPHIGNKYSLVYFS